MKKLILFLSIFPLASMFAQSQYTVQQAENSNDPEVIKNFISKYPNHQKTPQLRRKLATISMGGTTSSVSSSSPITNNYSKSNSSKNHSSTAAELNHLLNGSNKSNSAYASVNNMTQCNLVVNFAGKTIYQLEVPAGTTRKILVNKGNYHISTMICGSRYQNTKNIISDYYLTLDTK